SARQPRIVHRFGRQGGRWYSRACDTAKPYVCKVPPLDCAVGTTTVASTIHNNTTTGGSTPMSGRCSDGWTYVAVPRGKCVRITESRDTWPNTWAEYKRLGGDLVSILDNATNYALRDYVHSEDGFPDYAYAWFAIGLYRTTIGGQWQWTDGTPVTYTNWDGWHDDAHYTNVTFFGVYGQNANDYGVENARWEALWDGYRWL
ncbi:hypothetical protein AAVH_25001, partial [Aphelenchoides avenae]